MIWLFAVAFVAYLVVGRSGGAVAMFIAVAVSAVQAAVSSKIINSDPYLYHIAMWLIAFGWCIALDKLKLHNSMLVAGAMVICQAAMIIDGASSPHTETLLYTLYPFFVITINLLMIMASYYDRNKCDFVRSDILQYCKSTAGYAKGDK